MSTPEAKAEIEKASAVKLDAEYWFEECQRARRRHLLLLQEYADYRRHAEISKKILEEQL